MKLRYRVEKIKAGGKMVLNLGGMSDQFLNRLGDMGWELVDIVPLARGGGMVEFVYAIFKQPRRADG